MGARERVVRVLAFLWGRPSLVEATGELFRGLDSAMGLDVCVVTDSVAGKLSFAQQGLGAHSLRELILHGAGRRTTLAEHQIRELVARDTTRGQRWGFAREVGGSGAPDFVTAERIAAGYERLFDIVDPDLVVTWNGWSFVQALPVLLARRAGRAVLFLERGLVPGTLFVDPQGVNAGASVRRRGRADAAPGMDAETRASLEAFCRKLGSEGQSIVAHGASVAAADLRARLGLAPADRLVLLPLQVETDSNILAHSPHYKSMSVLMADVERAAAQHANVVLLVRPHPEVGVFAVPACGPRVRIVGDVSLHSLLRLVDAVVTINSTVGLEALTQGIPVLTLGEAIYSHGGWTSDVDEPGMLREALGAALSGPRRVVDARFLGFLHRVLRGSSWPLGVTDTWNARATIAAQVAELLCHSRWGDASRLTRSMVAERRALQTLFANSGTDAHEILLLGNPRAPHATRLVRETLARLCPGTDCASVPMKALVRQVVDFGAGRRRNVLAVGPLSGRRRLAWNLLPVRHKVLLF